MARLRNALLCFAIQLGTFAAADFHIVELQGTTTKLVVPSKQYNCAGIEAAFDKDARVQGAIGSDWMFIRYVDDFCGADGLDFYKKSNGQYNIQVWDGTNDGSSIGYCYSNESSGGTIGPCPGNKYFFLEKLSCITYLCN